MKLKKILKHSILIVTTLISSGAAAAGGVGVGNGRTAYVSAAHHYSFEYANALTVRELSLQETMVDNSSMIGSSDPLSSIRFQVLPEKAQNQDELAQWVQRNAPRQAYAETAIGSARGLYNENKSSSSVHGLYFLRTSYNEILKIEINANPSARGTELIPPILRTLTIYFPEVRGRIINQTQEPLSKFQISVRYDCNQEYFDGRTPKEEYCQSQIRHFELQPDGSFVVPTLPIPMVTQVHPDGFAPDSSEAIYLTRSDGTWTFIGHVMKFGEDVYRPDTALMPIEVVLYESPDLRIPFTVPGKMTFQQWYEFNFFTQDFPVASDQITDLDWGTHSTRFFPTAPSIAGTYNGGSDCFHTGRWERTSTPGYVELHILPTLCAAKGPGAAHLRSANMNANLFFYQRPHTACYMEHWTHRYEIPQQAQCSAAQGGICLSLSDFRGGQWLHKPFALRNNRDVFRERDDGDETCQ